MNATSTLALAPTAPVVTSTLSRQHRAWVALYSLEARRANRTEILLQNGITESDLTEHMGSWLRLRYRTWSAAA